MAINFINTGSGANSGDGDSIRTAFTKINQNFVNLEGAFVGAGVASFNGQGGVVTFSATDVVSLLGYIPYSSTNPQNFLSSAVLDTYATQAYVQNSLTNYLTTASIINFVSSSTLVDYATLAYVNNTLTNYLTPATLPNELSAYVTATYLLSLNYQDANQVNNAISAAQSGYVTTASLLPYSTIAYVDASVAAAGAADRIVAKDGTGTVVAYLGVTVSGQLQSYPGSLSFQNMNTNVLAFEHSNSSTYTKLSGRLYGNTGFTSTVKDYTLEFDFARGELKLPEYDAVWDRHYSTPLGPARPGWPLPGGSGQNIQRSRIFATNYKYEKDLNTTEYFHDWGKAVVLAVDVDRQKLDGNNDTFYNYLQVTANGVEMSAHSGTIALAVSLPEIVGGLHVVSRRFYEFSTSGITFPDGSVQTTAAAGGAINLSAVGANIVPDTNATRNLGSTSSHWNNVFVQTATIYSEQIILDAGQNTLARTRFLNNQGSNSYGLTDDFASQLVIVNEENGVKQAIWLGDSNSTGNSLFGISVHDSITGNSTGAEANWRVNLDLKGTGRLDLPRGGLRVAGNIDAFSTGTFIGSSLTPFEAGYIDNLVSATLNLPYGGGVSSNSTTTDYFYGGLNRTVEVTSEKTVRISTNDTSTIQTFIFTQAGSLTYPDGTTQSTAYSSTGEQRFNIRTANFNAAVNQRYGVSTTATAVTATLPGFPALGDAIFFADAGGNFAVNNLTLARNGNTIMGSASNLVVNINGDSLGVFWNGSTWRLYE